MHALFVTLFDRNRLQTVFEGATSRMNSEGLASQESWLDHSDPCYSRQVPYRYVEALIHTYMHTYIHTYSMIAYISIQLPVGTYHEAVIVEGCMEKQSPQRNHFGELKAAQEVCQRQELAVGEFYPGWQTTLPLVWPPLEPYR